LIKEKANIINDKNKSSIKDPEEENRWGNNEVKIIDVRLFDKNRIEKYVYKTGEDLIIEVKYQCFGKIVEPVVGIGIFRNDGISCYGTNTNIDYIHNIDLKSEGIVKCYIENNNLLTGEYKLDVAFHTVNGFDYDYFKGVRIFRMYSDIQDIGITRLKHDWHFE